MALDPEMRAAAAAGEAPCLRPCPAPGDTAADVVKSAGGTAEGAPLSLGHSFAPGWNATFETDECHPSTNVMLAVGLVFTVFMVAFALWFWVRWWGAWVPQWSGEKVDDESCWASLGRCTGCARTLHDTTPMPTVAAINTLQLDDHARTLPDEAKWFAGCILVWSVCRVAWYIMRWAHTDGTDDTAKCFDCHFLMRSVDVMATISQFAAYSVIAVAWRVHARDTGTTGGQLRGADSKRAGSCRGLLHLTLTKWKLVNGGLLAWGACEMGYYADEYHDERPTPNELVDYDSSWVWTTAIMSIVLPALLLYVGCTAMHTRRQRRKLRTEASRRLSGDVSDTDGLAAVEPTHHTSLLAAEYSTGGSAGSGDPERARRDSVELSRSDEAHDVAERRKKVVLAVCCLVFGIRAYMYARWPISADVGRYGSPLACWLYPSVYMLLPDLSAFAAVHVFFNSTGKDAVQLQLARAARSST